MNCFSIKAQEYYEMPDLFQFDDYQKCLGKNKQNTHPSYCIVNTYVKPDYTSVLYNYINEFSMRGKQHFRHDKLQRGICMEKCMKIVADLGEEAEDYYIKEFPMNSKLTFDVVDYINVKEDRVKFNKLVNICINTELMGNYNLSGYSSIEYCIYDNQSFLGSKCSILISNIKC